MLYFKPLGKGRIHRVHTKPKKVIINSNADSKGIISKCSSELIKLDREDKVNYMNNWGKVLDKEIPIEALSLI